MQFAALKLETATVGIYLAVGAAFRGGFKRLRQRHIHPFPRINCMKASIFFVI
jgi:hypothetical protein